MTTQPPSRSARVLMPALLCLALAATTSAQSQATSGQIAGAVTDANGAAVPNAIVKATNAATGLERTATTSEDGLYNLVQLPPGTYAVSVRSGGFAETKVEGVVVNVGRAVDVNVTLGAGGVSESIDVVAEAVQTTRAESDAILNERAIENLPINGRRFQDFVTLTPAAQVEPDRGQISLAGQRGINANISIDGADYNQPFFGGIRGGERSNNAFTIPQESIREFQVVSSGYTAEFGRSTGGIVNAVTKSGTNEVRGSAFYLLRHKELARANAFGQAASPTQQQFGGSVGGPLIENKLFFFGAYEQQIVRNPRQVLYDFLNSVARNATPGAGFNATAFDQFRSLETAFTQTNDAVAFLVRADWEISSANRFNLRYNQSKNEALNAAATGEQIQPATTRALSSNGTEEDQTYTLVGQLTSIFSGSLVNELRGQYSRENRPRTSNAAEPGLELTGGISFGTRSFFPTTQYDYRIQFADNLTWTKGNHTAKFGGEYNHTFADQLFGFNQFGVYSVSGSNATALQILSRNGTNGGNFLDAASNVVSYTRQIGNLQADYAVNEFAFFGQDSWRLRPNFTLSYGLRYEAQLNPDPEANNASLIDRVRGFQFPAGVTVDPNVIADQTNQWGPRVGFAWDIAGDSKSVLRANAGVYYARTPLLLLAGAFNNFRIPPGDLSVRLPLATTALAVGNPLRNCTTLFCQLGLIGVNLNSFSVSNLPLLTPEQVQSVAQALGLPGFDPFAGVQPIVNAPEYENPRSFQWNAAYERELSSGLTVGADFAYVNTVHLQRNLNINLPAPILRDAAVDPAQRPFFGIGAAGRQRPVPALGNILLRDSSARSLFRAFTLRANLRRRWGQVNAYYTLSKNLSDDDNERNATGLFFENPFDLRPEYNYADTDRRHQFVANPLFFLPYGFDASAVIRLRSARPVDATVGSDLNQSLGGDDRPFQSPGAPFRRNAFRSNSIYDFDLRVQKGFQLGEHRRLVFSTEFFNLFGFDNIEIPNNASVATNQFCANTSDVRCGLDGPTNVNFLQTVDQAPTSARFGQFILANTPGAPFQMQVGVRLQF